MSVDTAPHAKKSAALSRYTRNSKPLQLVILREVPISDFWSFFEILCWRPYDAASSFLPGVYLFSSMGCFLEIQVELPHHVTMGCNMCPFTRLHFVFIANGNVPAQRIDLTFARNGGRVVEIGPDR